MTCIGLAGFRCIPPLVSWWFVHILTARSLSLGEGGVVCGREEGIAARLVTKPGKDLQNPEKDFQNHAPFVSNR